MLVAYCSSSLHEPCHQARHPLAFQALPRALLCRFLRRLRACLLPLRRMLQWAPFVQVAPASLCAAICSLDALTGCRIEAQFDGQRWLGVACNGHDAAENRRYCWSGSRCACSWQQSHAPARKQTHHAIAAKESPTPTLCAVFYAVVLVLHCARACAWQRSFRSRQR